MLEVCLLGPLEVRVDGRPVPLAAPRQQTLLARLALTPGAVVPVDALVDALWGDDPPPTARNSLQSHLSRLRSALAGAGARGRIETRGPGYALRVELEEVDAASFEALVQRARAATDEPERASAYLQQALDRWRGPALAGLDQGDQLRAAAVRLEELRLQAIEARFDAELAAGRHSSAVPELQAAVAAHPLRERLWHQLLVALWRDGRQTEAVRAGERYRRLLGEETGLSPGPTFAALADAVVRGQLDDPTTGDGRPPVTPAPPRTAALPTPATSFVGRGDELAAARRRLAAVRLLTITGVGGIGKTRFALELARAAADDATRGVHVAELAALRPGDAIGLVVADLLGARPASDEPVAAAIARQLHGRPELLVLDNCEHVLDSAAELVTALLTTCPELTVLATSRERLAVDGEHVWPLAPLADAEAADLLAARARAHRPGFTLDRSNRDAVADINRRLDGLPLALELAAARLATVSPAELAVLLGDPFRVLAGVRRTGEERHRTLREVLAWSWRLLAPSEQAALAQLSLFAAPFTLPAAAAVLGVEDVDALDALGRLVDASLLQPSDAGGSTRYRMLDTVRRFAADRLAERADAVAAVERHTAWAIARAVALRHELRGPQERSAADQLEAELADVRTVHQRLVDAHDGRRLAQLMAALPDTWVLHHAGAEPPRWLLAGAPVVATAPGPHQAAALAVAATAANLIGEHRRAAELISDAPGADGDPSCEVQLAVAALYEGRLTEAELRYRNACEHADDPYERAHDLGSLAMALAYQGRAAEAAEAAACALREAAEAGAPSARAWASYAMGEACAEADPARAMVALDDAVAWARRAGSEFTLGLASHASASLSVRHGEPAGALRRLAETLRLWHRSGTWTQLWTTVRNTGEALARLGAVEESVVLRARASAAPEAARIYGRDADRDEALTAAAEAELGADLVAALGETGSRLGADEAVDFALRAIDAALAGSEEVDGAPRPTTLGPCEPASPATGGPSARRGLWGSHR